MASEFDKPVSSGWNCPDTVRVNSCKAGRNDRTDIRVNVGKVPSVDNKCFPECSTKPTVSKSEASRNLLQNSQQSVSFPNALDVSLLLTKALYGASNLPYQFAQSPSGAISPFGLLPLGFPYPTVPVVGSLPQPTNPIHAQFVSTAHVRPAQRTNKQKSSRISKRDLKFTPRSSHSVTNNRQVDIPRTKKTYRNLLNANAKNSLPASKVDLIHSAGTMTHGCTRVVRANCPVTKHKPISSLKSHHPAAMLSFLPAENSALQSMYGTADRPYTLSSNAVRSTPADKLASTAKSKDITSPGKAQLAHTLKDLRSDKPNRVTSNIDKIAEVLLDRQGVNDQNRAREAINAGILTHASFGDAEAAATLLGLRHGLGNTEHECCSETLALNKVTSNEAQEFREDRVCPVSSANNSTDGVRTMSAGTHLNSNQMGAVDLTTRSQKHEKTVEIQSRLQVTPHTQAKVTTAPKTRTQLTSKHRHVGGNEILVINADCNTAQQVSVPSDSCVSFGHDSAIVSSRHFILPTRAGVDDGARTSVVAHLPSYICAFDCRSHLQGFSPMFDEHEEMMLKSQNAANNGGFNFKKVIYKKFTQSMSSDNDNPCEHECSEVYHSDIVFDPSMVDLTASRSSPDQLLGCSSAAISQRPLEEARDVVSHSRCGRQNYAGVEIKRNSVSASRDRGELMETTREKSMDRAIDFRVKKRSSSERHRSSELQSRHHAERNNNVISIDKSQLSSELSSKPTRKNVLPPRVPISSQLHRKNTHTVARVTSEVGKVRMCSVHSGPAITTGTQSKSDEISTNSPSFSDLREKSRHLRDITPQGRLVSTSTSGCFNPTSSHSKASGHVKDSKQSDGKYPVSNLYRVRNSTLGDSNDSLDSIGAESEKRHEESDVMSDSSCTSCESGYSRTRGRANSSGSDADTDHDASDLEDMDGVSSDNEHQMIRGVISSQRPRFILNRPKFTLNTGESFHMTRTNPLSPEHGKTSPAVSKPMFSNSKTSSLTPKSSSSKVKMRQPTFTFSSDQTKAASVQNTETRRPHSQGPHSNQSGASTEKSDSPRQIVPVSCIPDKNVPELKSDEGDDGQSFKSMLIKALNNGNQKEGLAVDGKALRALLGGAKYFFHNNRKYVLKRALTKVKPKEGFISDVSESNVVAATKKNEHEAIPKRATQAAIEPRVSVTATAVVRKKKIRKKAKSKKEKRSKSYDRETAKRSFIKGTDEKGKIDDDRAYHKDDDDDDLSKTSATNESTNAATHKRHRRMHEIENLIFEGAGGLTPIPDISLRDSDVFSNIKLRRREAAKRGIAETIAEESCATKLKRKTTAKAKCDRKELIKTAARERAFVNKSRRHSIEKRLKRYQKRNRIFIIKKQEDPIVEVPRASCVRINAGVLRPHLEVQAFATEEIRKFRKNSEGEATEDMKNEIKKEGIDLVTAEKQTTAEAECGYSPDKNNGHSQLVGPGDSSGILSSTHNAREMASSACSSEHSPGKLTDSSIKSSSKPTLIVEEKCRTNGLANNSMPPIECHDNNTILNDGEESTVGCDVQHRYPKRCVKVKPQTDSVNGQKSSNGEDTLPDNNNFESDSVRSNSPSLSASRTAKLRKRGSQGRASPLPGKLKSAKSSQDTSTSTNSGKSNFCLLSYFPLPSAITLGPAFGDLQPSYSVKHLGPMAKQTQYTTNDTWHMGADAQETKQHLQREVWRNMTLDMFNNNKVQKSM